MKTERFLRTRIVLYLILYLLLIIIFAPLQLLVMGLEYLFGKITYKTEPRLRHVSEKQFKSKLVKWFAANFHGLYEKDVKRKNEKIN